MTETIDKIRDRSECENYRDLVCDGTYWSHDSGRVLRVGSCLKEFHKDSDGIYSHAKPMFFVVELKYMKSIMTGQVSWIEFVPTKDMANKIVEARLKTWRKIEKEKGKEKE